MRINLLYTLNFFLFCINCYAGEPLTISKEFNLFTSKNLQGYTKPLFTSIEQSINSNIYQTAYYHDEWRIGIDISASEMSIPKDQLNYEAERPDLYGDSTVVKTAEYKNNKFYYNEKNNNQQPTIYGGHSTAIFAAPQNHFQPDSFYKSVAYVEGNNIHYMAGLPTLQLIIGCQTRTEIRFRFLFFPLQGSNLYYWGLYVNQNIDKFIDLFSKKDNMSLALHGGISRLSRTSGIDITSWAFGAHFSRDFGKEYNIYAGFQFEGINGSITAIRINTDSTKISDSPYLEVRSGKPLQFNIQTFTNYRFNAGINYHYKFIELHFDAAWGSQPIITTGISFLFYETKKGVDVKKHEKYEYINNSD